MPQYKGCIPWNKGLTRNLDSRIKSNRKKIFSDQEKQQIIQLYQNKISPTKIGKFFNCSIRPIKSYLDSVGVKTSISEWRLHQITNNRIQVNNYNYDKINLKIIDGFINRKTNKLNTDAILELTCSDCQKEFQTTFNGYKSKLKYNKNILCNKCSHKVKFLKHNKKVKSSKQQRKICRLINAKLNFKISGIYTDMALIKEKIIIEYDGWVWHGNKNQQNKDRRRDEFIKSKGWKILRIKGNKLVPTKTEIEEKIQGLITTNHKYDEIIMSDWGQGKTFYDYLLQNNKLSKQSN